MGKMFDAAEFNQPEPGNLMFEWQSTEIMPSQLLTDPDCLLKGR